MKQLSLLSPQADGPARAISPMLEMGAYETLWARPGASFRRIAETFRQQPDALPSDLVDEGQARAMAAQVMGLLEGAEVGRFGVMIHGSGEYPAALRDARNPVELLYYQGWWNLVETPCVAVVGTRNPSAEGVRRARRLSRQLVEHGWTVVAGLARGIDTVAHLAAIDAGGRTIGVLGTPLSQAYPRENEALQRRLAREHLIISQVPVYCHAQADYRSNRRFFPQRNYTMSALSRATIIVEAGDGSGTLVQARGALQQGRKLFILDSCFRPELEWPKRLEQRGAIRVGELADIRGVLGDPYQD